MAPLDHPRQARGPAAAAGARSQVPGLCLLHRTFEDRAGVFGVRPATRARVGSRGLGGLGVISERGEMSYITERREQDTAPAPIKTRQCGVRYRALGKAVVTTSKAESAN